MGLKVRSRELGEIGNLSKYLPSNLTGHAGLDSSKITTSFPSAELVVFTFMHLNYHETFIEENIASSNSRNIIKSKKSSKTLTNMVTFHKSTGLSRLQWIKSEEIGSLRLTVAVSRILLDADLTASTTGLSVGEGAPAMSWAHLMPY